MMKRRLLENCCIAFLACSGLAFFLVGCKIIDLSLAAINELGMPDLKWAGWQYAEGFDALLMIYSFGLNLQLIGVWTIVACLIWVGLVRSLVFGEE